MSTEQQTPEADTPSPALAGDTPVHEDSRAQTAPGASERVPPKWLFVLGAVALVATAASRTLPVPAGPPVTAADLTMALAFAAVLFGLWRYTLRVGSAPLLFATLAAYCLAALLSGSGKSGALESIQRVEQLFCGTLVFAFLLSNRRRWVAGLVGLGLAANVVAALWQMRGGYGVPVTGLFHSRMALGFYLALALVWSLPYWLAAVCCVPSRIGCVAATALVLFCIAHGQMLLIACLGVLLVGFLHSRQGALLNTAAVALLLLVCATVHPGTDTLRATLSPFSNGQLNQYGNATALRGTAPGDVKVQEAGKIKQSHTEVVAAFRMAADNPLFGIGAGKYQSFIGAHYGELPNPSFNAVETDTQSGLGILVGTMGFPVAALVVILLLHGLSHGLRRFLTASTPDPAHLAGAGALAVTAFGLLISDPFVRGVGWYPALALASVFAAPRAGGTEPQAAGLGLRGVIGWGAVYAVLIGALLGRAVLDRPGQAPPPAPAPSPTVAVPPAAAPEPGATVTETPSTTTYAADFDFFRVIDASDMKEITEPMILEKDTGMAARAAKKAILRIPDKKGVPPDGEPPAMKYGGAVFDLDVAKPTKCKIWLRVWWEGSCGNTIYVRTEADPQPRVVGNDGTYDAWHWLPAPALYELDAGTTRLYLLNREDGIRLDQILVTGDLQYVPQGIEEDE